MILKVVGVVLAAIILNVRECDCKARADGTRNAKFFGFFSRLTGSGEYFWTNFLMDLVISFYVHVITVKLAQLFIETF